MHDYERFAHYDVDYQACDEEFARRIERREQKLNDAWEYGHEIRFHSPARKPMAASDEIMPAPEPKPAGSWTTQWLLDLDFKQSA